MNPPSPTPLRLLRDFSDRLSPMVVKELRHGLRTNFFMSALIALHLLLILLMAVAWIGADRGVIHVSFWTIAILSLLGFLPLRGFGALASETESGTFDMLTLTSMPSFRIVYGKWAASFSQSLLVASSLLPYMIARHQFGGVEIAKEALAMALLVLGSAIMTAAITAFSSQKSLILRIMLSLAMLAAAFPLGVFIAVMAGEPRMGDDIIRELAGLHPWQQAAFAGGTLLASGYAVYFFIALGASRVAPPSENHSTVKRIVAFAVLAVMTAGGIALAFGPDEEQAFWLFVPSLIIVILNGMDVLTEPMPRFPTAMLPLVRRGSLVRSLGTVLHPGWATGLFFYLLISAMPLLVLCSVISNTSSSSWNEFLSFCLCLLTAVVVPVCLKLNRSNSFANWWAVQIALFVAGILLLAFANITNSKNVGYLGVFTPVTAMFGSMADYSNDEEILGTGAIFGGLWLGAAMVLAISELHIIRALVADATEMLLREKPAAKNNPKAAAAND